MVKEMRMLIIYYFFLYLVNEVEMKKNIIGKIVYGFEVAGIIASSILWLMKILECCVEWAENGMFLRVWEIISKTLLFGACLFLMWILHKFAMFTLHKLWPDSYDEYGHTKK